MLPRTRNLFRKVSQWWRGSIPFLPWPPPSGGSSLGWRPTAAGPSRRACWHRTRSIRPPRWLSPGFRNQISIPSWTMITSKINLYKTFHILLLIHLRGRPYMMSSPYGGVWDVKVLIKCRYGTVIFFLGILTVKCKRETNFAIIQAPIFSYYKWPNNKYFKGIR